MEAAHRELARICGELSLALVRHSGSRARLRDWAARLRSVADQFDAWASGGKT